ncbi:inositol monophosphatase family protein [Chloroflexota bacterium]
MIDLPLSRSDRTALEVATQAAEEAGNLLLEQAHGKRQLTSKNGRANFVTDVDVLVEKRIISLLQSEYPDYNILTEEANAIDKGSEYTWVIDPLDGTNNYIHGIPFYSVSIALTSREDILLGTIYDPWMKELFRAEKGAGAWLNDHRIAVSDQKSLSDAFIGSDMGYDAEAGKRFLAAVRNSWPQMFGLRIMGSAVLGLAYVACGRLGIYVHSCLYPWDIASGILLVREAGGLATDWDGNPSTLQNSQVVAGNSTLHKEFMELLNAKFRP